LFAVPEVVGQVVALGFQGIVIGVDGGQFARFVGE